MTHAHLVVLASAALVVVASVSAFPSFAWNGGRTMRRLAGYGDPVAAGVFLGTGLVHMLPAASKGFEQQQIPYPWPFAVCGATALALGALQRMDGSPDGSAASPIMAVCVLAIHSLLAGAALGATTSGLALLGVFLALVAHKGAASFALSRLLSESAIPLRQAIVLQGVFVAALPFGAALGEAALHRSDLPLAAPVAMALGAGTFIPFGVGHGLSDHEDRSARTSLGSACGFVLMALIAAIA